MSDTQIPQPCVSCTKLQEENATLRLLLAESNLKLGGALAELSATQDVMLQYQLSAEEVIKNLNLEKQLLTQKVQQLEEEVSENQQKILLARVLKEDSQKFNPESEIQKENSSKILYQKQQQLQQQQVQEQQYQIQQPHRPVYEMTNLQIDNLNQQTLLSFPVSTEEQKNLKKSDPKEQEMDTFSDVLQGNNYYSKVDTDDKEEDYTDLAPLLPPGSPTNSDDTPVSNNNSNNQSNNNSINRLPSAPFRIQGNQSSIAKDEHGTHFVRPIIMKPLIDILQEGQPIQFQLILPISTPRSIQQYKTSYIPIRNSFPISAPIPVSDTNSTTSSNINQSQNSSSAPIQPPDNNFAITGPSNSRNVPQPVCSMVLIDPVLVNGITYCEVVFANNMLGNSSIGIVPANFLVKHGQSPHDVEIKSQTAYFQGSFGVVNCNQQAQQGNQKFNDKDIVGIEINMQTSRRTARLFINGTEQPCYISGLPQAVFILKRGSSFTVRSMKRLEESISRISPNASIEVKW